MAKLTPADLAKLAAQPEGDLQARIPDEPFDYQKVCREIKGMLVGSSEYEYAEGTLRGILETIERTHSVTAGQRRAIENIAMNPSRSGGQTRDYKRRWERE